MSKEQPITSKRYGTLLQAGTPRAGVRQRYRSALVRHHCASGSPLQAVARMRSPGVCTQPRTSRPCSGREWSRAMTYSAESHERSLPSGRTLPFCAASAIVRSSEQPTERSSYLYS